MRCLVSAAVRCEAAAERRLGADDIPASEKHLPILEGFSGLRRAFALLGLARELRHLPLRPRVRRLRRVRFKLLPQVFENIRHGGSGACGDQSRRHGRIVRGALRSSIERPARAPVRARARLGRLEALAYTLEALIGV